MANNLKNKRIILYYAEWCMHCQRLKPQWYKFKQAYMKSKDDIKKRFGLNVSIIEYDSDINNDEVTKAGIEGFPTIQIEENGNITDYTGERTDIGLFQAAIPEASLNDIQAWLNMVTNVSSDLVTEVPESQTGGFNGINYYDGYLNYKRKYKKLKRRLERRLVA